MSIGNNGDIYSNRIEFRVMKNNGLECLLKVIVEVIIRNDIVELSILMNDYSIYPLSYFSVSNYLSILR